MKAKLRCYQSWELLLFGSGVITITGCCATIATFTFIITNPVHAQIIPDNTLPVNSSVAPGCTACAIEGGTVRGSNLFHSFSEFSIPRGGKAFFNNDATLIQNIFTRVTGNSASNIDGMIRANGTANLFLINPNGIIFNPNASLNIGGSFIASTANSFNFSDGIKFSAVNSQTPPLLTINVPIGLQFGTNPGNIQLQGSNLEVNPGQTLALVGGNVQLNGGQLLALDGNVELGGMADTGTVDLNINGSDFGFSFPNDVERADVSLGNGTNVNVLAGGGGSIAINARSLDMTGESTKVQSGILSGLSSVDLQAGGIEINATEAINLNGSSISNTVQSTAVGNSGDINITTGSLYATNGGLLNTETSGQGKAGSINIVARDTVSFDTSYASSAVRRTGEGKGGNINITTGSLSVTNGGELVATNYGGKGDAGKVDIVARDTVTFDGIGSNRFPSGAFSNVLPNGVGNGVEIKITTGSLYLKNGAVLNARVDGKGDAGSVNIFARDTVSLDGNGTNVSSVLSGVRRGSEGQGGNIKITTGSLYLKNGAVLNARVDGKGDAGSVNIFARDTVSLDGNGTNVTWILSGVGERAEGQGGNINITTGSLSVINGGELVATNYGGKGNAGSVNITAGHTVTFDGTDSNGFPSGAFSNVFPNGVGKGADINIKTGSLDLKNGAVLNARTAGEGNAGNVNIFAQDRVSLEGAGNSGILSTVELTGVGKGGDINITTGRLSLRDKAQVTVSSKGSGIAGSLIVEANSIDLDNKATISADTNGGQGNINLRSRDLLLLRRGSTITTNATGNATGGNITIDTNNLVAVPKENSDISANAENSFGGQVIVNASGIFGTQFRLQATPLSDITANSARGSEFNGVVQLNTPDVNPSHGLTALPTNIIDTSQLIANSCIGRSKRPEGKFVITGNGGLPVMPDDPSIAPYQTYQIPTVQSASISTPQENALAPENPTTSNKPYHSVKFAPLIEAQGWVYGANGEVILTASAPTVPPHSFWSQLPTCSGS
ncbi:MAG: S-layer family protein [Nostoc sp. DedQUE05]|uniref:S-layer family protein n=1 Tax=Nostoc sp. DedQUE05 TaxID=3075391 RepID=UPI002AD420C3|nr:S-layer family protein [Nostoc sp. DedQUE05]MDZ8092202.1 S-layer family protein [Nostoc sp. DedQUE05]